MSNFFNKIGDGLHTLTDLDKDLEDATHGNPVDTTALANDFIKDLADVNVNLPWLTPDIVGLGLQAFFSAIAFHKPKS